MKLARPLHTLLVAAFLALAASGQNKALQCGPGARLVFPHHAIMNTQDAVTIEGWVRADPQTTSGQLLFHRYQPSVEHKMISIYADGEIEYVYAGSPWSVPHAPAGSFPVDGSWHHVAFVRHPAGNWQLFVDGHSLLSGGPAPGFGSGCWLTCAVINGTPPTVLETTPEADGWSVDEWRMSATDRYQNDFVPARYWSSDSATVMLLGFGEGLGTTVHDAGPAQQTGQLTGPFQWRDGPPHPSNAPLLQDDFGGPTLDTAKWTAIVSGIPGASVGQANGVLTLANKGYLRSNLEVDPLETGEVRVRGRWKWTQANPDLGTLEVLTRTDAIPDPNQFFEATNGLEFNLWLGPAYPGVAVIQPRGSFVQVGPPVVHGALHWTYGAWYEFEADDAGSTARWTIRESTDPSNSISVTCAVSTASAPVNYVAIHGREFIGGPNICELDGIEISVPDCNSNQTADAAEIQFDPALDLNGNGVLDGCECSSSNYCVSLPNSTGSAAHISHAGTTSLALDDLILTCSGLPVGSAGIFFCGTAQVQVPFGNGIRCVGGVLTRTTVTFSGPTGIAARAIHAGTLATSIPIVPGDTRYFQYWYRNPAAGGFGFNLSEGLSLRFCP